MLRVVLGLTVAAASLALSVAAGAADYRDPAGRFTVAVPEGWEFAKPDNAEIITLVMATSKSSAQGYDAACLAMYLDIAETKGKSQAEVNSMIDGQFTPEFWRQALQSSKDKDFKIDTSGSRDAGGRKVHNAVFTGTAEEDGKSTTAKGKMELHFVPGSLHSVMCVTDVATYEKASVQFDRIFTSYEPGRAALVASATPASPVSLLTMYSKPSYEGVAHVLSQDTPDLASAGWVAMAGSLTVDGAGTWQVCDGVNYGGTCKTVSSALSANDAGVIKVTSARRLSGAPGIQSAAATALRRGLLAYEAHQRHAR